MPSFSQLTKQELCEIPVKKDCCINAMLYGMLSFCSVNEEGVISCIIENDEVVSLFERLLVESVGAYCNISYYGQGYKVVIEDEQSLLCIYNEYEDIRSFNSNVLKCSNCLNHFIRGAFLLSGSIINPEKSFRLEMHCPKFLDFSRDILSNISISFKTINRRSVDVLYIKDSESISDFLIFIGASKSALKIIDQKIKNERGNDINRKQNFEISNMKKSIDSAGIQVRAINKIKKKGALESLSNELKETANLRADNPSASLASLASLHTPPITKSGLNHRLQKLLVIASEL